MTEQTVSEQLKDLSVSELKMYNDIWERKLTPASSKVRNVYQFESDEIKTRYYNLDETYTYGSGVVRASVEVMIDNNTGEHILIDLDLKFS